MKRLLAALIICLSWTALGQLRPGQRIDLLHSTSVTVKRTSTGPVHILKGDVAFKNRDGVFYCDSARWWRKDDRFLAYGNIRFRGKDGVRLSSQTLDYTKGLAFLRGQVVLKHESQTLKTPSLRYDTENETGTFHEGGNIETADGNLTCRSGQYWATESRFLFEGEVHALTKEYVIDCVRMEQWPNDHLYYLDQGGRAKTDHGSMNFGRALLQTEPKISHFYRGVVGVDSLIQFNADSLYQIEADSQTELYGKSKPAQWADWGADSMEIHAMAIVRTLRYANADGNVSTFIQGMASHSESMRWNATDSILHLFGLPVVWAEDYQVCADTLRFYLQYEPDLDSIYGLGLVHLSTAVDSLRSDEMAGAMLSGFMSQQKMKSLRIQGNAQALFHPDPQRSSQVLSAEILLLFAEGKLLEVQFIKGPQGDVKSSSSSSSTHLPGSRPQRSQRPLRMEAISGLK
ncbi:MAG: OstA-like protein [Schleiferiaceae bacterium]|nr:OstA-like protein [Schleiferiaceae bacterium]